MPPALNGYGDEQGLLFPRFVDHRGPGAKLAGHDPDPGKRAHLALRLLGTAWRL